MKKQLEVITFTHKGILITVMIDYVAEKISVIDSYNSYKFEPKKKEFIFMDRGLEYMNGWLNILDAIKYAITEAKKLLEADIDNKILPLEISKEFISVEKIYNTKKYAKTTKRKKT